MTLREAIERADRIKPNDISIQAKVEWLNEAEGLVQTEVLLTAAEEIIFYSPEELDYELLVEPPHDKLYPAYLEAKIDFANGEYSRYANSQTMFTSHFREFERWFADVYRPADTHGFFLGEQ